MLSATQHATRRCSCRQVAPCIRDSHTTSSAVVYSSRHKPGSLSKSSSPPKASSSTYASRFFQAANCHQSRFTSCCFLDSVSLSNIQISCLQLACASSTRARSHCDAADPRREPSIRQRSCSLAASALLDPGTRTALRSHVSPLCKLEGTSAEQCCNMQCRGESHLWLLRLRDRSVCGCL